MTLHAYCDRTLGTAVVNYWLTERKAKRDLRRTKLEELFLAFARWEKIVSADSIVFHRVMVGKLDYNQALDIVNEDKESTDGSHSLSADFRR